MYKKVAVFGGSFNPVSKAHTEIINKIRSIVDEVIIVPVGDFYDKSFLANKEDRYNMLMNIKKSKDWDNVFISRIELDSEKQLKTYETLNKIKLENKNNETEFYFVLGADNLFEFSTWYKAENILDDYYILAVNRDNLKIEDIINTCSLLKLKEDKIIEVKVNTGIYISSTLIRDLISSKIDKDLILSKNVIEEVTLNYIINRNLYK